VLFSLIATAGQWTLTRLALLSPMMTSASPLLGGGLLLAAGLYQWSPYKRSCLAHCQTPMTFVMRHGGFRSGPAGAIRDGAHHGVYCLGCCALLMTLLFVGGVMNILWIAGLSLLVLLEKIWNHPVVPRAAGAILMVAGLVLLVR
jgi:predicted metal-binding membrane protein